MRRLSSLITAVALLAACGPAPSDGPGLAACYPPSPSPGEPPADGSGVVEEFLSFPIAQPVFKYQFFVAPTEEGGPLHYTYRSEDALYVHGPDGDQLWSASLSNPQLESPNSLGTAHGAADTNGDGRFEIVALDGSGRIVIHDARTGARRRTLELPAPEDEHAHWAYLAIANLRGVGDRDVIVQSVDAREAGPQRYLNRTLLAWNLEEDRELWRVTQGPDPAEGVYRGYWGPAHGSFRSADVDGDGRDEVVGGNLVTFDGEVVDLGYPRSWVGVRADGFVDHLDAVLIGDLRSDRPTLEWIVTEEDHVDRSDWHTTMLTPDEGVLWRSETDLFSDSMAREPQNVAAGRFDSTRSDSQVWVRSRFPVEHLFDEEISQHPWLFDANGEPFAHYRTVEVLPEAFNEHEFGNCEGLELIVSIDWFGGKRDYIAAKARHVEGNIGVFDPVTGEPVWYSPRDVPATAAGLLYVADVTGDGREEVVIQDTREGTIRVYRNPAPPADTAVPSKWDEPHYRRIKQNWNYYSP